MVEGFGAKEILLKAAKETVKYVIVII